MCFSGGVLYVGLSSGHDRLVMIELKGYSLILGVGTPSLFPVFQRGTDLEEVLSRYLYNSQLYPRTR